MTDMEFAKRFQTLYNEVMSIRKDEDYEINQVQLDRFLDIYSFFLDNLKFDKEAEVQVPVFVPCEEHGDLYAKSFFFDIVGDNVKRFCDVMQYCSCFTINAEKDGRTCIEVVVPNVFIHK